MFVFSMFMVMSSVSVVSFTGASGVGVSDVYMYGTPFLNCVFRFCI